MESSSSQSPKTSRRCWFLINLANLLVPPKAAVHAVRKHPMVDRVDWNGAAATCAVHLRGVNVDIFRAHVNLLEAALAERDMAAVVPSVSLLALAGLDPRLGPLLRLPEILPLPIYFRAFTDTACEYTYFALHRPNPPTTRAYQVRLGFPVGKWVESPEAAMTLAAAEPVQPTDFYKILTDARPLADSFQLTA